MVVSVGLGDWCVEGVEGGGNECGGYCINVV